jgi:hypothetical protein
MKVILKTRHARQINLVNTTQTTKDRVIQTPLKTEGERQSMLMLPMIQFIISVCRLSHQRKLNK